MLGQIEYRARHDAEDMRDMIEGDVRFTLPFGTEV